MTWPLVQFGRLYAQPSRNGVYKPKEHHGAGVKIVNMGELFAHDIIGGQEMQRLGMRASEMSKSGLADGDLLFGRRSLVESGAGKCSLVEGLSEPTTFESSIIRVRVNPSLIRPRFLFYWLKSPQGAGTVRAIVTGTNVKGIRGTALQTIEVPRPLIDVQDAVISRLRAYDDLIENNRRRMALLEEAARQLYREWFIRLRFPGHKHTRIINGVPDGWQPKALGDLCEEVRESVSPDALEPDTPYIGLEHMPRRSISLSTWGTAEEVTSSKHRFREGEILFGKIRPYFHKVGIAFTDGVASSDAIIIRSHAPKHRGLVLMTASSDPFVATTAQTMREGSKMPRADWKQMQAYAVLLPPDGLLDNFEVFIRSVVEQLKTLTFTNQKLRAARDLLLPRLMSGQVAV